MTLTFDEYQATQGKEKLGTLRSYIDLPDWTPARPMPASPWRRTRRPVLAGDSVRHV